MTDQNYSELLPNIVLVKCSFVSIVLAKAEHLAVFDTGPADLMPAAILPALAGLDKRLSDIDLIVNTHGHWDHVQGNSSIVEASQARVWIPAPEAEKLVLPADRFLVDGDVIDLGGGLIFDVIATPGHSVGMSCFYERNRRLLIASDAVQGYGPGNLVPLYFHSGKQYRASLQRLLELDIEIIMLGHDFKWSGPNQMVHRGADNVRGYIQESLDASRKIETAMRAAIADCKNRDFEDIRHAATRHLANDPSYPFDVSAGLARYGYGTILSEMNDMGIRHTNPR